MKQFFYKFNFPVCLTVAIFVVFYISSPYIYVFAEETASNEVNANSQINESANDVSNIDQSSDNDFNEDNFTPDQDNSTEEDINSDVSVPSDDLSETDDNKPGEDDFDSNHSSGNDMENPDTDSSEDDTLSDQDDLSSEVQKPENDLMPDEALLSDEEMAASEMQSFSVEGELSAAAQNYCKANGLSFDGTEISSYSGSSATLNIPEGVTGFYDYCFTGTNHLNKIILPSTLTSLPEHLFDRAENLVEADFSKCTEIIEIPMQTFWRCSNLTTVILPPNIEIIGSNAFYGCKKLAPLSLPASVTKIKDHAFFGCESLPNLTFPSSLSEIGVAAFSSCKLFSSVDLSACRQLSSIEGNAFAHNPALKEVSLPDTITSLGQYCFANTKIETINLKNLPIKSLSSGCFSECASLKSVILPDQLTSLESYAFEKCTSLNSIDLPDSITSIGNGCFSGSNLESLVLPASLTTVGSDIILDCNMIQSLDFSKASRLTDVTKGSFCYSYKSFLQPGVNRVDLIFSLENLKSDKQTPWILKAFRWNTGGSDSPLPLNSLTLTAPSADDLSEAWLLIRPLIREYEKTHGDFQTLSNVTGLVNGTEADITNRLKKDILAASYLDEYGSMTADELWGKWDELFSAASSKTATIDEIVSTPVSGSISSNSFVSFYNSALTDSGMDRLSSDQLDKLENIITALTDQLRAKTADLPTLDSVSVKAVSPTAKKTFKNTKQYNEKRLFHATR